MKKLFVLLIVCIIFLSATPAFAAILSYNVPQEIEVENGIATLSIEVQGGSLDYAALRFQLALPDDVTITRISYTAAGDYTAYGPEKMPKESENYAGLTIFGIAGVANNIKGDVTCKLELSYEGNTNQVIAIKEIAQSIIVGSQEDHVNRSASSEVRLIVDSTAPVPGTTYSISGRITGSDEPNGLAAALQLINSSGASVGNSVTAASNGTYIINNVPAGTSYTIRVTMSGYNDGTIASFNVNGNVSGKNLTLTRTSTAPTGDTGTGGTGTGGTGSGYGTGNPTTVTISDLEVPTGSIRFSDVTENHWAYEFIEYLASRGFVTGKTDSTFGPSDNITRAEFVTILARMSGDTLPAYTGNFSDVDASAYYAQAVAWAVQAGVTQGTSPTTFSPNSRITRQDIATMLLRYAGYKNIRFEPINAEVTFSDDAQISAYAKEAVSTMQRAGIISGHTDGTFRALNNATRAEAAKMLSLVHNAISKQAVFAR